MHVCRVNPQIPVLWTTTAPIRLGMVMGRIRVELIKNLTRKKCSQVEFNTRT
jgi:hypothetical protein